MGRDVRFSHGKICYASIHNSLVIRANGMVGKCTVALKNPANAVGGLLPDGTLRIDNARLRPWLRGWESGDEETLGCPLGGMQDEQPQLVQVGHIGAMTHPA
jgi:uncharacterized protein